MGLRCVFRVSLEDRLPHAGERQVPLFEYRLADLLLLVSPGAGNGIGGAEAHLLDVPLAEAGFFQMLYLASVYVVGDAGVDNFVAQLEVVSVGVSISWHGLPPE